MPYSPEGRPATRELRNRYETMMLYFMGKKRGNYFKDLQYWRVMLAGVSFEKAKEYGDWLQSVGFIKLHSATWTLGKQAHQLYGNFKKQAGTATEHVEEDERVKSLGKTVRRARKKLAGQEQTTSTT